MRELFLTGRLKINKKCSNVLFELESYSYDDKGGEKPLKENDHLCDALRYVIMTADTQVDRAREEQKIAQIQNERKNEFF